MQSRGPCPGELLRRRWLLGFIGGLLVLAGAVGQGSPTLVQGGSLLSDGGLAQVNLATVTEGDMLVCAVENGVMNNVSISDSLGTAFAPAFSPCFFSAAVGCIQTWYGIASNGGLDTVTATIMDGGASNFTLFVHEFSSVEAPQPQSCVMNSGGPSRSGVVGVTATTAKELLFMHAKVRKQTVGVPNPPFMSPGAAPCLSSMGWYCDGDRTAYAVVDAGTYDASFGISGLVGDVWMVTVCPFFSADAGTAPDAGTDGGNTILDSSSGVDASAYSDAGIVCDAATADANSIPDSGAMTDATVAEPVGANLGCGCANDGAGLALATGFLAIALVGGRSRSQRRRS
jgi:hypothetical protein